MICIQKSLDPGTLDMWIGKLWISILYFYVLTKSMTDDILIARKHNRQHLTESWTQILQMFNYTNQLCWTVIVLRKPHHLVKSKQGAVNWILFTRLWNWHQWNLHNNWLGRMNWILYSDRWKRFWLMSPRGHAQLKFC